MMRQRATLLSDAAETRKPKRRPPAREVQSANNSGSKLSYKDKYALETLPKRIAALENEITSQNEILADNGLFERDRIAFEAAVMALAQAEVALTELENQWLELEVAREEVEKQ